LKFLVCFMGRLICKGIFRREGKAGNRARYARKGCSKNCAVVF